MEKKERGGFFLCLLWHAALYILWTIPAWVALALHFTLGITRKVIDRVTSRLGEPIQVYRAADEKKLIDRLSSCNGGIGAYYFTEDVFFVAFQTHVLAFLMGNFE